MLSVVLLPLATFLGGAALGSFVGHLDGLRDAALDLERRMPQLSGRYGFVRFDPATEATQVYRIGVCGGGSTFEQWRREMRNRTYDDCMRAALRRGDVDYADVSGRLPHLREVLAVPPRKLRASAALDLDGIRMERLPLAVRLRDLADPARASDVRLPEGDVEVRALGEFLYLRVIDPDDPNRADDPWATFVHRATLRPAS